jgi:hypothetical protein
MIPLASIFSRLHYEDWALMLPGLAFFIFFTIFLYIALRITRMPRRKSRHLAEIPFEDEEKQTPADHGKHKKS